MRHRLLALLLLMGASLRGLGVATPASVGYSATSPDGTNHHAVLWTR